MEYITLRAPRHLMESIAKKNKLVFVAIVGHKKEKEADLVIYLADNLEDATRGIDRIICKAWPNECPEIHNLVGMAAVDFRTLCDPEQAEILLRFAREIVQGEAPRIDYSDPSIN